MNRHIKFGLPLLLSLMLIVIIFSLINHPTQKAIQTLQDTATPPIKKIHQRQVDTKLGDKIVKKLEKKHGDLLYEEIDSLTAPFSQKEVDILTYEIKDEQIHMIKSSKKRAHQNIIENKQKQHELWKRFANLIPSENRKMVAYFKIFTDGEDNTLGYVQQMDYPDKWTLALDYRDVKNLNGLYATILHEYGHLFSLNSFEYSHDNVCKTYDPGEGCLKQDAYLYHFYQQFWQYDVMQHWKQLKNIETDPTVQTHFYTLYADEFVTEYATSHPTEDFAESFMYFILSTKPSSHTRADEKVLFFYQYPELAQLRNEILMNLEKYYP